MKGRGISRNLWSGASLLAFMMFVAAPVAAGPAGGQMPPMPVEAQPVVLGEVLRTVEAVGTLRADEAVVLRPELQGRVSEILFEEGQPVQSGQPLIRLDAGRYRAQLNEAIANRDLARVNYRRAQELVRRKVGSADERDKAEAELQASEARVALQNDYLAKMTLTAPFDGIAGIRSVSIGEVVQPAQALVQVVAVDPVKVDFRIPELYVGQVQAGQSLDIRVDAFPGEQFTGKVYAVAPQVDDKGRSLRVRATVPNPEGRLRPGLFARVELILERFKDAVRVPEQAIVPRGDQQLVYRIVDGKAEIVPVTLGIRRNAQVQVTDGLAPGDVVITAGQMKVRPGAPVQPVNLGDGASVKGAAGEGA